MTKARIDGLILVMLGAIVYLVVGIAWRHVASIEMGDFKVVYYSARCLLQHGDPYSEADVLRTYTAEGRERSTEPIVNRQVMTRFFYPPTAFIFTLPFAAVGFEAGGLLWSFFLAASFILAAVAVCDLAADYAPLLGGALAGLVLMNSFWMFMIGNSAGIAVSFCAISIWCFYRRRCVFLGVLLIAISLALKPNDSGLIWLFLVLAGGHLRRWALQAVAALVLLSIPVLAWVNTVSPRWPSELRSNMASLSGVGSIADPAVTGMAGRYMDSLVQLQSAISIVFPVSGIYDLLAYAVCVPLFVTWVWVTVRRPPNSLSIWLALAAAAPLSMLPTYHFQHDAKLLLLAIPACAALWAKGGRSRWASIILTTLGILVTGDVLSGIRIVLTRSILIPEPNFISRLTTTVLTRPAPLVLLAMTIYYLWRYARNPHTIEPLSSPRI